MTKDNQQSEENKESEIEEDTPFVKLLKKSMKKIKSMKHIDSKVLAENYIFPLMAAMYDEVNNELNEVYNSIGDSDYDDAVLESIADSPWYIKEVKEYIMNTVSAFDALSIMTGLTRQSEENQNAMVYTEKATPEIKQLFQAIRESSSSLIMKTSELEDKIKEEFEEINEDDEYDDLDGDDDEHEDTDKVDGEVKVEEANDYEIDNELESESTVSSAESSVQTQEEEEEETSETSEKEEEPKEEEPKEEEPKEEEPEEEDRKEKE